MSVLSVVLPAYNEEQMIAKASSRLSQLLEQAGICYELVFVNDGSTDRTWQKIEEEQRKNPHVAGVRFSRNFGKESAVFAGLAQSSGDVVAVMDCDLQHPPETLLEMYRLWEQGYEVIEGVKESRGRESVVHRGFAGLFYKLMSTAAGFDMQNASDFKMLDRKAVDSILSLPESNMFFRAVSSWVGFSTATVSFRVQEREAGVSKWSTGSLVKYAITNIVAFTSIPMQIVTVAGLLTLVFAIALSVYSLVQYFSGDVVSGYTTTLLALLFIGSVIMISLGIIGYYISKIYDEVRHRPRYIISEIARDRKEEARE